VRGTEKIATGHRERTALIYVRQSSLAQVRDNTESTARQYALAEEAVRLGWPRSAVEVIDADLGLSGRSAERRSGFKDLVGRVCVGEVGAVFGLEVSRLARSSADLSRLLELARLTDTLVVDADGIYDLANFNDRLLLGLKGTMSEAELHLLAGRLQGAKRAAAERGELRFPLPVGFVYDDDGNTVIDPDAEVQAAVADVFAAFRAGGSAYQVVAAFRGRRFPLRAYGGVWAGQLRWGRLTHSRVLGILANPSYAGVYVFGRYRSRRVVSPDGVVSTKTVELPREEWPVVIHDHHPSYICWDDYLANGARLAANLTNAGARPPREGHALCQGIIGCGSCGRPMTTRYHRNGHAAYECSASRADQMATPTCRSITATTVDDAVAERLLDALNPEEVALALAAADEIAARRARSSRAAELAVERARYEAERAERAFHACEPENRLVARSLETRWEARLAALAEADKALADQRAAVPPLPSRAELETLTADVSALWHAPTTAARDRKRLLRTLIADVTLLPEPDLGKAGIGIRWHTGATDELVVTRRMRVTEWRRTDPAAIELAGRLAHLSNRDLAERLNSAGHLTGAGRPFDTAAVANLRQYHRIPPANLLQDGEATVSEVARRLGVSQGAVIHWIHRGWLTARRGLNNQWCVPFGPDVEHACRERVAASVHLPRVDDSTPATDDERTVGQVAAALGISTNVVYYWIERHHIDARRGPGGRWLITFTADVEAACRARVAASVHLKPVTQPQSTWSISEEAV
jgi:DNA invertase Pin-like site-specific DNA recombinase/transposase-like protein